MSIEILLDVGNENLDLKVLLINVYKSMFAKNFNFHKISKKFIESRVQKIFLS